LTTKTGLARPKLHPAADASRVVELRFDPIRVRRRFGDATDRVIGIAGEPLSIDVGAVEPEPTGRSFGLWNRLNRGGPNYESYAAPLGRLPPRIPIGSRRMRTERSVTVTIAPAPRASSISGHTFSSN